jgi:NAD pyrophosphatase/5'-nucleotidase NadN
MNKSYLSLSACALLATFTFVGCGSSNSSSPSTGTLQLNPTLGNIDYICGSNSGTTDESGKYKFTLGDECEFTFGGVTLKATPSANLTIESILEDTTKNPNISQAAIWGYVSAATGLSQAELSKAGKAHIKDDFKNATDDITDFSSFDRFESALLDDDDFALLTDENDISLKEKFETNKAKISSVKTAKRVDVRFEGISTPVKEETKLTQQSSSKVYINGEKQEINYTSIMKTGFKDTNNEVFGLVKDMNDEIISFEDGNPYICNGTNEGVGSGLDYTSFLNVNDKLYMVSQFECQIGAMYMTELVQNEQTGALTPKEGTLEFISQKDEFGGFVHCAGQKTPWESHLGSEEYENDARAVEKAGFDKAVGSTYYDETVKFWGGDFEKMSPYYYGWTPEVKITQEGEADYSKHYAMGRFSHELSYVMPDNKTVYMSDDGTNVGLYMFVADKPTDLTSGTLYAAKWEQTSEVGVGAGEADISWINLGHATNSEIREYLDPDGDVTTNDGLKFSDIFDAVDGTDGTCSEGYTSINTSVGHECLKIKDGMEKAASRLETRRYSAMMGATTEFRKEEGITYDKNTGTLYVAMSSVERGMEDNQKSGKSETKYDIGGNNDIKVQYNSCGAIYALDVNTQEAMDLEKNSIASKYVVNNMYSILEGNPTTYDENSDYSENSCDVNGISNPDNVTFLENSNILMIGEDTGKHENNMVWAYDVQTKELTRVFTTPIGAETTSPFWYTDLANGYGYMSVVTQHPDDKTSDAGQSVIGYVGPFKNLTKLEATDTVSIFHVNDTHSHISSEGMDLEINGTEIEFDVGGYARYVTKLDELKKNKPNSLILNAGDVFQGTLYYSLFKGEADAAAMNMIKWDAYALGNHEFDDGDEGLKSFLDMLNEDISVISSNVVPQSGNILENYWKPYIVKEINGKKVGVIGIDIVGKTKNSSNPSDTITFLNEIETAQKYIDELKDNGVDRVVLLTHQGYDYDLAMASQLSGVDVIVGGDSHSLLGDFSKLGLSSVSNDYPTKVSDKDGNKVCVVQAWEYGHILGDLDVVFNKDGEVIDCSGTPRLLVGTDSIDENLLSTVNEVISDNKNIEVVVEDEATLNVIKNYENQVDVKKALVIGEASETLGHNRIPGDMKDGVSNLPLGSDIAPIVAKSFYDLSNLADACIQNAGGVRVKIDSGNITMGDAYTLLPFANTLFEIKMKAQEIKDVLEDAIEEAFYGGEDMTVSTGSFPYSYGLKYDVDASAQAGNRIQNLEMKDRETGTWSTLNLSDDTTLYTIVTNSYTAGGKDGYLTFKSVQDERGVGTDTYLDYAMSFVKYVETKAANNELVTKLPAQDHPIKSFVGLK